jgi:hypothetical protein
MTLFTLIVRESVTAPVLTAPGVVDGTVNVLAFQSFWKNPIVAATAGFVGLYTESVLGPPPLFPPPPPPEAAGSDFLLQLTRAIRKMVRETAVFIFVFIIVQD